MHSWAKYVDLVMLSSLESDVHVIFSALAKVRGDVEVVKSSYHGMVKIVGHAWGVRTYDHVIAVSWGIYDQMETFVGIDVETCCDAYDHDSYFDDDFHLGPDHHVLPHHDRDYLVIDVYS